MEFFLNEWSLQSQFAVVDQFAKAAIGLIALVARAREVGRGRSMLYRSERMDHRCAIGSDPFPKTIHALGREVKEALLDIVYNRSAPAPWEVTRLSKDHDTYHWLRPGATIDPVSEDECGDSVDSAKAAPAGSTGRAGASTEERYRDVSDTSMAELAERLMCMATPIGCLFNFADSELAGPDSLDIVKNRAIPATNVASFDTVTAFDKWFDKYRGARPYDAATAKDPPLDEQTCLVDRMRFEPTSRPKQHGRTLYEERTTRDIYYVDNLHWGGGAHLEVFSRMGKHKGEASIDGKLKDNTRDKNKDYTLDD